MFVEMGSLIIDKKSGCRAFCTTAFIHFSIEKLIQKVPGPKKVTQVT